jgi:hypothetical protein
MCRSECSCSVTCLFISLRSRSWDRVDKPTSISVDLVGFTLSSLQTCADLSRDTRSFVNPVVQYIESHSDDVTEVCLRAIIISVLC